jgi:hypothetical protein
MRRNGPVRVGVPFLGAGVGHVHRFLGGPVVAVVNELDDQVLLLPGHRRSAEPAERGFRVERQIAIVAGPESDVPE